MNYDPNATDACCNTCDGSDDTYCCEYIPAFNECTWAATPSVIHTHQTRGKDNIGPPFPRSNIFTLGVGSSNLTANVNEIKLPEWSMGH